ncbi:hypothetical protein AGOR_G00135980 [Albula goreensis]|uniref:Uncharacterized protein n=1 Tax=Albula goreensis TaxID=1534307 RepID=A0A8T3D4Y9_9TELE|nr:hypothetical protein AGOR_G00135980 [Albula goreensis]
MFLNMGFEGQMALCCLTDAYLTRVKSSTSITVPPSAVVENRAAFVLRENMHSMAKDGEVAEDVTVNCHQGVWNVHGDARKLEQLCEVPGEHHRLECTCVRALRPRNRFSTNGQTSLSDSPPSTPTTHTAFYVFHFICVRYSLCYQFF